MNNLVQSALPPKSPNQRASTQDRRLGDDSFSDILRLKPGKQQADQATEAERARSEPPLNHPFRVAMAERDLSPRLSDADATPAGMVAGREAENGGDLPGEVKDSGRVDEETAAAEDLSAEKMADETDPPAVQPVIAVRVDETGSAKIAKGDVQTPPAALAKNPKSPSASAPPRPEAVFPARMRAGGAIPGGERGEADAAQSTPRVPDPQRGKAGVATAVTAAGGKLPLADRAAGPNGVLPEAAKPAAGDAEPLMGSRPAPQADVEARQDAPRLAGVKVLDAQSFPAPPQASLPSPAASVASAIAETPEWISFARAPAAASAAAASQGATPVKTLTIQLHPAELGVVTAKLRVAGEQLTVELQVERGDAYERLSVDRDAMVKAVRAVGLEVDRITIQQTQSVARNDPGAAFNGGSGRETGFAPGGSDGRESGGAGGQSRENGRGEAHTSATGGPHGPQSEVGRGLYI